MRYEISFNTFNRALMTVMLMGPRHSVAELTDSELVVRFGIGGYGFAATIPRPAIASATPYDGFVGGWGVHGWAGRWLVNGSSQGIVELALNPLQRGRVLGVPVKLRRLRISLVDRDGFIAALGGGARAADRSGAG